MLQVRLTEMPLPELEESVKAEIDDNPALEVVSPDDAQPVYDASDNSLFDNDEGDETKTAATTDILITARATTTLTTMRSTATTSSLTASKTARSGPRPWTMPWRA